MKFKSYFTKVTEGAELPPTDAIKIQNLSSLITAPFRFRSGVFRLCRHAYRGAERADVRGNEYATARTAPQMKVFAYFLSICDIGYHNYFRVTYGT